MEWYLAMKWLHVLGAGVVLGLLATYPLLPSGLPREGARGEREVLTHVLRFLHVTSTVFLTPAIVLLFVTGVLMTVGPIGEWNVLGREGHWIILGMALWVAIAGLVGGALLGLVKEMVSLAAADDLDRARLTRLWRHFRWTFLAGVVVTIVTYWVMVFQPVF